jgi:hypothetical protein
MASMAPYSQLTGVLKVYLAAYGETEPNVNATPGANWIEVGPTDGEQSIEETGPLTYFYDNNHISAVKATRPQEDHMYHFTLVGLTLEQVARIKAAAASVVSTTMNGATVKRLPTKRGYTPTTYALLFKGDADSPYGVLPGQRYVPYGVFEGEATYTRAKDGRPGIETTFHALEDDAQAAGSELGWDTVQY